MTERLKKAIIRLIIDEVTIDGEKLKISATILLPNKIHEREIVKADTPDTFNAGATLGPVNETNMTRIWNKHKQLNTTFKPEVFVAMSGGVDSSVAAALLKKRGFEVVGVHIRCYNVDGCAAEDVEDARRAAESLNIPFYVFDFEEDYKREVVEYMVQGYKNGITPNPDVMCNKEIKFGLFLKKALSMGARYIATGHYARRAQIKNKKLEIKTHNSKSKNIFTLYQAKDKNKDQSYFLWTLGQEQLRHCIFPLGDYTKPEVRKLAKKFHLHNSDKKDSQGICFLGRIQLQDFLGDYIKSRKGRIELLTGEGRKKIGEHKGIHNYTIGQRRIGVANKVSERVDPKPFYVVSKDVNKNIVTVAEGNSPYLYKKEIKLKNVNFINPEHSNILKNVGMSGVDVYARVRYRQPLFKTNLQLANSRTYKLIFAFPQKSVAPGQSAVFYTKTGELLGGGVID